MVAFNYVDWWFKYRQDIATIKQSHIYSPDIVFCVLTPSRILLLGNYLFDLTNPHYKLKVLGGDK